MTDHPLCLFLVHRDDINFDIGITCSQQYIHTSFLLTWECALAYGSGLKSKWDKLSSSGFELGILGTHSPWMSAHKPTELSRTKQKFESHDDVIKWKHFPRYWPFLRGIHRSPVNSPHKGQWRGALMFSLICARINDWVNNRETGDLRRHLGHYDVNVMASPPIL